MEHVTWADICNIFSAIHSKTLGKTEHDITCERLIAKISKREFFLEGDLTINRRPIFSAGIAFTLRGLSITASVNEWVTDDGLLTIHNASSSTLQIGKGAAGTGESEAGSSTNPSPESGFEAGLEGSGDVSVEKINVKAALMVRRTSEGKWF